MNEWQQAMKNTETYVEENRRLEKENAELKYYIRQMEHPRPQTTYVADGITTKFYFDGGVVILSEPLPRFSSITIQRSNVDGLVD